MSSTALLSRSSNNISTIDNPLPENASPDQPPIPPPWPPANFIFKREGSIENYEGRKSSTTTNSNGENGHSNHETSAKGNGHGNGNGNGNEGEGQVRFKGIPQCPANSDQPASHGPASTKRASASRVNPATIRASSNFHRRLQHSLLSSEAPPQNFRGLFNLAGLILVTLNARLVVENFSKYGLLVGGGLKEAIRQWDKTYPCLLVAIGLFVVTPILSHLIEVLAVRKKITHKQSNRYHTVHILLVFLVPQLIIGFHQPSLGAGLVLLIAGLIMTMKAVSFAHVCHDVRREIEQYAEKKKKDEVGEPSEPPSTTNSTDTDPSSTTAPTTPPAPPNYVPTLFHSFYFYVAPTLIYQLTYPRSPSIRLHFVVRKLLELAFCLTLQLFLIEQYVVPTIANSMVYMEKGESWAVFERILKLAIPNTAIWLLMFYSVFHSYLNLSAELLRFGDRIFYLDWWNSQSLDVYWRSWNLPVHNWMVRHLYAPALRHGYTPIQAQLLAFLVSAIGYEVLVSVPCRTVSFYAFVGMLAQIPLIALTKLCVHQLRSPVLGNLLFWLSFVVMGQPLIILLYSYDYLQNHR